MASEGAVQVALRIKPITEEKPTRFQRQVITTSPITPNQVIIEGKKIYHFDYVFPPETTQKEVYEVAVENLVNKFLGGYNVTILAYGQTSSGKTYTMGTADNSSIPDQSKGIIPRAMVALFNMLNNSSLYLNSMKVSFIEIYNEDLIDLLGEGECRPQVAIREDTKENIFCDGLQEVQVNHVDEVMEHLARGSLNRRVGATDMNAESSRSHAIFTLTLSQQKIVSRNGHNLTSSPRLNGSTFLKADSSIDDDDLVTITSKFRFVDLAGSEKFTATNGDRAKEGISINKALSELGNVISALRGKNAYIPYRNSKLTRLLQDSLGGNAQTLMIACVSSAERNINETINTLQYTNRARDIINTVTVNQEEAGWNDVVYLQNLVLKLRNDLKAAPNTTNGVINRTISPSGIGKEKSNRNTLPITRYHSPSPTGVGERKTLKISGRRSTSCIPILRSTSSRRSSNTSSTPSTPISSGLSSCLPTPTGTSHKVIIRQRSSPHINVNQSTHNHKDNIDMELEKKQLLQLYTSKPTHQEELLQLQQSYFELSQKLAKAKSELAMHQENHEYDEILSIQLKEKENMIRELESELEKRDMDVRDLEERLKEREVAFKELEGKLLGLLKLVTIM